MDQAPCNPKACHSCLVGDLYRSSWRCGLVSEGRHPLPIIEGALRRSTADVYLPHSKPRLLKPISFRLALPTHTTICPSFFASRRTLSARYRYQCSSWEARAPRASLIGPVDRFFHRFHEAKHSAQLLLKCAWKGALDGRHIK